MKSRPSDWEYSVRVLAACTLAWCSLVLPAGGASVRFAVIGDYGEDNADELAVANLVKTNLQPDFVVTVGDNYYLATNAIDTAIGKYYHTFIGNYLGSYGAGASSNRYWPAMGNHDYNTNGGYKAYLDYFTLPGNERYYDLATGPVHFFMANSDVNEPDGATSNSVQALWISNRMATATEPWKLVLIHHEPYSSSGSTARTEWPFGPWGASAVLSGHAHNYERLNVGGLPYFVDGLGGAPISGFGTPLPQSQARYNAAHGAMLVVADERQITFQFYSVAGGGTLIDTLLLVRPQLTITRLAGGTNAISWSTNGNAGDFGLEWTASLLPGSAWSPVSQPRNVQGTQYIVLAGTTGSNQFFRLRKP